MSNYMYLSRTRFETLDQKGNVVSTTFGACVYDDIGCAYANPIETLDELLALDADGLIDYIGEFNEEAKYMISTVLELGQPLYVDDERYNEGSDDDDQHD